MINIRKRGSVYQYCFEAGKVNGKRKPITKSGFRTKNEAYIVGQKAYDEFINGVTSSECNMLYSDYLDWAFYYLKNWTNENDQYIKSRIETAINNLNLAKVYEEKNDNETAINYIRKIIPKL